MIKSLGPDECWPWTGPTRRGRGSISISGQLYFVTRIVWRLFRGSIPGGLEVCHSCDTPQCCNPDHLFLGTHADNMLDRDIKNRNNSKLTNRKVRTMRAFHAAGVFNQQELGEIYEIGSATVSNAINGKSWKHV